MFKQAVITMLKRIQLLVLVCTIVCTIHIQSFAGGKCQFCNGPVDDISTTTVEMYTYWDIEAKAPYLKNGKRKLKDVEIEATYGKCKKCDRFCEYYKVKKVKDAPPGAKEKKIK